MDLSLAFDAHLSTHNFPLVFQEEQGELPGTLAAYVQHVDLDILYHFQGLDTTLAQLSES
jgi:hypothetical protein